MASTRADDRRDGARRGQGGWPDTTHDTLRGQKTASFGYVAASGPLLAVPVLAGGDGVDGTALSFAVEDRKKEKEKEKARKKKEAQEKADLELAKRDPW